MAKDFRIVEPEFMTKAKQSAVAAVESRFAHEESKRRELARRARMRRVFVWTILLVVAAAGGVYYLCRRGGIRFSDVTMRVHEAVRQQSAQQDREGVSRRSGGKPTGRVAITPVGEEPAPKKGR